MLYTAHKTQLKCTHCGAAADVDPIVAGEAVFCCEGCHTVYDILNQNNLCDFYALSDDAAVSLKGQKEIPWSLEELNLMASDFTVFENEGRRTVLFHIPSMHCSSCIWLLEKLSDLDAGIISSRTDFLRKQLKVTYHEGKTSFGSLIITLKKLGYEPNLMPEDAQVSSRKEDRTTLIKLGVAGFCTGNIMMFSFPQYLGLNPGSDGQLTLLFNNLNIVLSLPLIFYCAGDYFTAFYHWLRYRSISVKVPLALGIGALWLRSIYEAYTLTGPGYFDSLAGLVFFLIAGTWLQNKAFDAMRFGEKARKFFPMVARTVVAGELVPCKVTDLKPGDRVRVISGEIIPADGILMGADAVVEYAYATGESAPQHKVAGEVLLGGGRNAAGMFEMEVIRPFDQGRLNEIWKTGEETEGKDTRIPDFEVVISRYFIITTLVLAILAFAYWMGINSNKAWFVLTAVLMVACPCALALAPPFSYNIVANFFASNGLFLRKPAVAGQLGQIRQIVFDKTGTLTEADKTIAIIPASYSAEQRVLLYAIASQSRHPYSVAVCKALQGIELRRVDGFSEKQGKGVVGRIGNTEVLLGNLEHISGKKTQAQSLEKALWFRIGEVVLDPIQLEDVYRNRLGETLSALKHSGKDLYVASGDVKQEAAKLDQKFPNTFQGMEFQASPAAKAQMIHQLQAQGHVMMVGDGLNDAGALKTGDVGIVVAENSNNFTPEASAILLQSSFDKLPDFLRIASKANRIVKETFVVSLIYNAIALSLAVTGQMSPLIAAILMPASSVALMLYAWGRTKLAMKKEEGI